MTDYATTLADLVSHGREARIQKTMDTLGRTRAEATIIEDATSQAVREACRAIGAAVDTVSVSDGMQADVLAITCALLPDVVNTLCEFVLMASVGITPITPDCDCEACTVMQKVVDQIEITQTCE